MVARFLVACFQRLFAAQPPAHLHFSGSPQPFELGESCGRLRLTAYSEAGLALPWTPFRKKGRSSQAGETRRQKNGCASVVCSIYYT
jgi:hypothetical protein